MRLWHYKLLPYLPELQFKGQLRELVAIMHDWRDKGKTNHLLINRVLEYSKKDLTSYFLIYDFYFNKIYKRQHCEVAMDFIKFAETENFVNNPFDGWHNKEYLRV